MLKIKCENILKAKEKYLVHQCNCKSIKGKGLSEQIFTQYEQADTYKNSDKVRIPGTISCHDINENLTIINLYGQRYPGVSKYSNDTKEQRLNWFKSGLDEIAALLKVPEIAVPYNIGCGLAGGNWEEYYKLLLNFSQRYKISVTLYKI